MYFLPYTTLPDLILNANWINLHTDYVITLNTVTTKSLLLVTKLDCQSTKLKKLLGKT